MERRIKCLSARVGILGHAMDATRMDSDIGRADSTAGAHIRLRAISSLLANKRQLSEIAGPFQASFSRAVKSLIRKGLLRVPPFITFEDTTASPRHRDILTQDAYGCREDGEKWLVLEAYCGNSQRMVVRQPATIRFVVSGVRSFIGHPDWWITRFESLEKMGRARLRIIQAKRKKVERAVRRLKMQQIIARSLEKAVAVVTQDLRGHSATAPNQT